jgi:hypothetical protein
MIADVTPGCAITKADAHVCQWKTRFVRQGDKQLDRIEPSLIGHLPGESSSAPGVGLQLAHAVPAGGACPLPAGSTLSRPSRIADKRAAPRVRYRG